jgi:CheY-like chemotaxis protein/anti-sigma regulatory factor (Ser/Thr protein kinase)
MLPAAHAKGVALSATIAPRSIVLGDVERLRQVVANLLTNAVKFTPAGGTIEVSVVTETDFVRIAVRDTGRGIATRDLLRVFERFKQVDSSTTPRTATGLGLGLAIVDHIVRAHGGDVAATSAGSGFGATFVVRLRRIRGSDENEPTPITCQRSEEGSLEGCEILCVDNDIDALEVTAIILRQGGALVTTARSAAEALVVLASSTPDVVLSDIGLPSEDGYELIRQIRRLPNDVARAPAIALTAYADEASAELAREAGFQLFLSKPIAPDDLVRAIAQVAGRHV